MVSTGSVEFGVQAKRSLASSTYDYSCIVDETESNDSQNDAIELSPPEYYTYDSYLATCNGTLTCVDTADKDFFYFCLLTESNVSINAEITSGSYSLGFTVFSLVYDTFDEFQEDNEIKAFRDAYQLFNDQGESLSKGYNALLTPGTYYILLEGKQPTYQGISMEYSLSLGVSKNTIGYESYSLGDLRYNKNLEGAVALSDYLPLGPTNINNPTTKVSTFNKFTNRLHIPDFAMEDFRELNEGSPIYMGSVYLWGETSKVLLKSMADLYLQEVKPLLDAEACRIGKLTAEKGLADNCIKLTCLILDAASLLFPAIEIVTDVASLILELSSMVFDFIFEKMAPTIPNIYSSITTYLYGLACKLSNLGNEIVGSVLELPIYYTITKAEDYSSDNPNSILTFIPSDDNYMDSLIKECTVDTLSGTTSDFGYARGKVYGLTSLNDLVNATTLVHASQLEDVSPTVSTVTLSDAATIKPLGKGDYAWVKFTAKTAGLYSFHTNNTKLLFSHYSQPVKGYSETGLIATSSTSYYNESETKTGYYYELNMSAGETAYFRIYGEDYCRLAETGLLFSVISGSSNHEPHVHSYSDSYVWKTTTYHCANCSCGASINQVHAVSATKPTVCLLCKGTVKTGLVGGLADANPNNFGADELLTNTVYFGSDSYLVVDNYIFIGDADMAAFLDGTLTLPEESFCA